MGFVKLWRRNRWPVIIPLYDVRQCVHCGHLVAGWDGQRLAHDWHQNSGEDEWEDPGGFIVPDINNGALPIETRGGRDDETERNTG